MKSTCLKIALMAVLTTGTLAHASPQVAPDDVIKRIATPENISKDELIQTLIGTWQCTYRDDEMTYDSKLVFDKNGTLSSQKTSRLLADPKDEIIVYTYRNWQVAQFDKMWLLAEKVTATTLLGIPPALDEKTQLKSYLNKNPTESSLMSFETKDGKPTLTRINDTWGFMLGECVKQ